MLEEPLRLVLSKLEVWHAFHEGGKLLARDTVRVTCNIIEHLLRGFAVCRHLFVDRNHRLGVLLIDFGPGLTFGSLKCPLERVRDILGPALCTILAVVQARDVPLLEVSQLGVGCAIGLNLCEFLMYGFQVLKRLRNQGLRGRRDLLHLVGWHLTLPREWLRLCFAFADAILGRDNQRIGLIQNALHGLPPLSEHSLALLLLCALHTSLSLKLGDGDLLVQRVEPLVSDRLQH
mmetsp:Transcript_13075/g.35630  ORF Transcript_13075/g.35630 Transcript_13075/m.35630 type:complete len:233 (-) Transcript_13075:255-953(-)